MSQFLKTTLAAGAIALGLLSTAYADNSGNTSLKATDGTQISIAWHTSYSFDQNEGVGTATAQSVSIKVNGAQPGSQAVVLNNCGYLAGPSSSNTYKCDLQATGGPNNETTCSVGGFVIAKDTEGDSNNLRCSQQIAVVMKDNSWLVDPYGHDHNFNFQLGY